MKKIIIIWVLLMAFYKTKAQHSLTYNGLENVLFPKGLYYDTIQFKETQEEHAFLIRIHVKNNCAKQTKIVSITVGDEVFYRVGGSLEKLNSVNFAPILDTLKEAVLIIPMRVVIPLMDNKKKYDSYNTFLTAIYQEEGKLFGEERKIDDDLKNLTRIYFNGYWIIGKGITPVFPEKTNENKNVLKSAIELYNIRLLSRVKDKNGRMINVF